MMAINISSYLIAFKLTLLSSNLARKKWKSDIEFLKYYLTHIHNILISTLVICVRFRLIIEN